MKFIKNTINKANSIYIKNKKLIITLSLAAVFLVALYLRLDFVLNMNHPPLKNDAYNYDVMAKNFLDNGYIGYTDSYSLHRPALKPNAVITPGYPLFLSAIYTIFGYKNGSPLMAVRIIQAFLGALTCILIYLLGKRVKNRKAGLISAALYALYPSFVWATTLILTETLYNFFFVLYLYLQLTLLDNIKSKKNALLCGLIFAVAVMVRPTVMPLIVIPFIYKYIKERDISIIKTFCYTCIGIVIIMLPWWTRNLISLHKLVLLATQTGNPLIAGTFPYYQNIDASKYNVPDQVKAGISYIIEGFRTQPILYLKWFTIGKFTFLFKNPWFNPPQEFTSLTNLQMLHSFIICFGWFGVVLSFIRRRYVLISLFIILLTGLQLLFVPETRYAQSIIPLLIILTANIVDHLLFGKANEAKEAI
ncbi:MAG: glycosyltransferase family 39 protein [Bacillota bacterium]|nr:glycosyltransferase family 39 protein [Bacillota bacterium]